MWDLLREWGPLQITPGHHPAEWRQPSRGTPLQRMVLVGCTLHEAHLVVAVAFMAHDEVLEVTALVHVRGGSQGVPTVAALLKMLRRSRDSISVKGMSLRCSVRTERVAWEIAEVGCEDPFPPRHVLQVCWIRLEGDGEALEDHPDHDPAPVQEEFLAVAHVA